MKDRPHIHTGVYTRNHGFMSIPLFQKLSNTGPQKERPVQVSAVQFRKRRAALATSMESAVQTLGITA